MKTKTNVKAICVAMVAVVTARGQDAWSVAVVDMNGDGSSRLAARLAVPPWEPECYSLARLSMKLPVT